VAAPCASSPAAAAGKGVAAGTSLPPVRSRPPQAAVRTPRARRAAAAPFSF